MKMIVEMFENTKLDIVKKYWLQGEMYLLLDRFDPTVLRCSQLF